MDDCPRPSPILTQIPIIPIIYSVHAHGSDIKYVNGGGNKPPFLEHIEYIDRQITIAATGGLLTMLSESGSGTLAGSAHSETFLQIARSDAVLLSGVLQRDIDVTVPNEFFPGQPVEAYFESAPVVSDQSSQIVEDALRLAKAGVRIDVAELSEKTGYGLSEHEAGGRGQGEMSRAEAQRSPSGELNH